MQLFSLFLVIFVTSLFGFFYPSIIIWLALGALLAMIYLWWQHKRKGFWPQSQTYRELEKIKKKRFREESRKHKHINDQIAYIDEVWGYTKEQKRIIEKFVEERAYSKMYNKLTASLLPQIIILIDNCNDRGQKGCKREVSKHLRELTDLMKEELKKKRSKSNESFETTLEVYKQLLKEAK